MAISYHEQKFSIRPPGAAVGSSVLVERALLERDLVIVESAAFVSVFADRLRNSIQGGSMRPVLGWMMILLTPILGFAQATPDWNAVTSLVPASLVRVTGTRAGVRQHLMGKVLSADATRITLTGTSQGDVFFDRVSVQRIELVIGDPFKKQRTIMTGLGYGAIFAAIGTVNGILGGFQEGNPAILYAVTLGSGVGIGALKSIGKGAKYLRIYERP
jgi:hypothetical protein